MKKTTRWLWCVPAFVGVGMLACSQKDVEEPATWSTESRTINYSVTEKVEAEERTFDLTLAFDQSGVNVTELGSSASTTMAPSGRLTYLDDSPPVIYELIALSILPDGDDPLRLGQAWSKVRPSDEAAAASKGIVAQERFDYEILALSDDRVSVNVKGFMRLAPTSGLAEVSKRNGFGDTTLTLLTTYKPYSAGTAEFDRKNGQTLRASGSRVPFAFMTLDDPLASDAKSVAYSLRGSD